MRAIVINPAAKTVTEAEFSDDVSAFNLIGEVPVTSEMLPPEAMLIGDDFGLLRRGQAYWRFGNRVYGGTMMLVGCRPWQSGAMLSSPYSVDQVASHVQWTTRDYAREFLAAEGFDLDAMQQYADQI